MTYQEAWEQLYKIICGYIAQSDDNGLENDARNFEAVRDTMISIQELVEPHGVGASAVVPSAVVTAPAAQYVTPSFEQLVQYARAALPGAPDDLIDLCANVAWSVLNGANPQPEDRIVHAESIRFLQNALEGTVDKEPEDGVTSGTIEVVL